MQPTRDNRQLDLIGAGTLLISTALLFLASGGLHPYSFYQLLRWIVCLSAVLGAWRFTLHRWYVATAMLIFVAILFNPLSAIRMSRSEWVPYDVCGAIGCLVLALILVKLSTRWSV
jgi:hypothetical protein